MYLCSVNKSKHQPVWCETSTGCPIQDRVQQMTTGLSTSSVFVLVYSRRREVGLKAGGRIIEGLFWNTSQIQAPAT